MSRDRHARHDAPRAREHTREGTTSTHDGSHLPASVASVAGEPLGPASLLNAPSLRQPSNSPARFALMRQLQQTYGNRATRRALAANNQGQRKAQSYAVQRWEASRQARLPAQRAADTASSGAQTGADQTTGRSKDEAVSQHMPSTHASPQPDQHHEMQGGHDLAQRVQMPAVSLQRPAQVPGVPIQRVVSQIIPAPKKDKVDEDKIGKVLIIGRPKKVFGNSMGDHTTAFAVHVQAVTVRLEGKTYVEAVRELNTLVEAVGTLPGLEKEVVDRLPDKHKQRLEEEKKQLDAIKEKTTKSVESDKDEKPNAAVVALNIQEYVNAYLSYRESIPFSTVNVMAKSPALAGKGKGESGPAALLAKHEKGEIQEQKALQEAIFDLFDSQSVALVAAEFEGEMLQKLAPGLSPETEIEDRVSLFVNQHVQSISSAFPKAWEDSQVKDEDLGKKLTDVVFGKIEGRSEEDRTLYASKIIAANEKINNQKLEIVHLRRGSNNLKANLEESIKLDEKERTRYYTYYERLGDFLKKRGKMIDESLDLGKEDKEDDLGRGKRKRITGKSKIEEELPREVTKKVTKKATRKATRKVTEEASDKDGQEDEKQKRAEEKRKQPLATQIRLENDVIVEILSGGRSPSPFKSATMGAHTTAWVVHVDRVKNALQGKEVPDAVKIMTEELVPEAKEMEERLESGEFSADEYHQNQLKEAKEQLKTIGDNIVDLEPNAQAFELQRYINALLTYINFIPGATLATTDIGGKSEGVARKVLRNANENSTEDIQRAILQLLDVKAVEDENQVNVLLENHLEIISKTYGTAYKRVKSTSTTRWQELLTKLAEEAEDKGTEKEKKNTTKKREVNKSTTKLEKKRPQPELKKSNRPEKKKKNKCEHGDSLI